MFHDNFGQIIIEAFSIISSIFFQNHLKFSSFLKIYPNFPWLLQSFIKFFQWVIKLFFKILYVFFWFEIFHEVFRNNFRDFSNFKKFSEKILHISQNTTQNFFIKYFSKFSEILLANFRSISRNLPKFFIIILRNTFLNSP